MADNTTQDWRNDSQAPLFWQTDLDLERAQIVTLGQRFLHASSLEPVAVDPGPTPSTTPPPVVRPRLVAWLTLIASGCVVAIVRWPETAGAVLLASVALGLGVVISALAQLSRTIAQQRENRALREALRQSRLSKQQLRFDQIRRASKPAA